MADDNIKCIMDNNEGLYNNLSSSLPTTNFFGKFFDTRKFNFTNKLLGQNGSNSKLSSSPKTPESSFEESSQYFSRSRTQSVSSDVSLDEFNPMERRSSSFVSDRIIALQVNRAENKFANYRRAITSYFD